MGEEKLLSREALRSALDALQSATTSTETCVANRTIVEGHVSALEANLYKAGIAPGAHSREVDAVATRATQNGMAERISNLEQSLSDVVADRDAALAELKGAKERLISCEAAAETARKERDVALARLKPSGQVAKDVHRVEAALLADGEIPPIVMETAYAALSTLATKAHGYEAAMEDLTRLANEAASGTLAPDLYQTNGGRGAAEAVSKALASLTSRMMTATSERDAAVADNAAWKACVQEAIRALLDPTDPPRAREVLRRRALEQHRKKVVRARNERLERAAETADNAAQSARLLRANMQTPVMRTAQDKAAETASDLAVLIRREKEPEQ